MDHETLKGALKSFLNEYKTKIKALGYHLAVGVGHVNKDDGMRVSDLEKLCLAANIYSTERVPEEIKKQIRNEIPRVYPWKGEEVPVVINYRGTVRFREE